MSAPHESIRCTRNGCQNPAVQPYDDPRFPRCMDSGLPVCTLCYTSLVQKFRPSRWLLLEQEDELVSWSDGLKHLSWALHESSLVIELESSFSPELQFRLRELLLNHRLELLGTMTTCASFFSKIATLFNK